MPVKSSLPPAPERLLKVIRCGCKTNCDTKRCTCRRNGLQCTVACSDCKGISCSNSKTEIDNSNQLEDASESLELGDY